MGISTVKILRLLLLGLLTVPLWLSVARATSCAPPTISMTDLLVRPGDEVEVRGHSWSVGCADMDEGGGCSGGESEPEKPTQDIRLLLEKKDSKEQSFLTEVDAGPAFRFRTQIVIPDVEPGMYRIVDDDGMSAFEPGSLLIRRRSSG